MKVISESTDEPITLAEAIQHARAYADSGEAQPGALISRLITRARQAAEQELCMSLVQKTVEVALSHFYPSVIELPYGPVRAITSITYADTAGVDQVLAADQYRIDPYVYPTMLLPAYNVDWPEVRYDVNAVRIRYTVGYPSTDSPPEVVPEPILQAMHLMISHWFNNRDAVGDDSLAEIPRGAKHLLGFYRRGLGV